MQTSIRVCLLDVFSRHLGDGLNTSFFITLKRLVARCYLFVL